MFSAKWAFVIGLAWVGFFSMGVGFSRSKTTIIVLRAFTGIGASATIPSAIRLIVNLFNDPTEQALALSIFVRQFYTPVRSTFANCKSCSFSFREALEP